MKKALSLTIIGGLLTTMAANAQVKIHISGSTAFRSQAFRAIRASFDGGAPTAMYPSTATVGTSTVSFTGTMSNLFGAGVQVNVYAAYDGSVRGIADLTGANLNFNGIPSGTENAKAEITFSDVDKSSTLFPDAGNAITETPIAVLPFVFAKNYYTPATVTNINTHQIQALYDNGSLALSLFTCLASDDTNTMYVTGRNLDSGTRVIGTLDTYYTGTPTYYGFNTNAPTVWAQMNQNLNGLTYGVGYSSGGNEATALTNRNAGGPCIGYLGVADAFTVAGTTSTSTLYTNLIAPGGTCGVVAYNGAYPFANYSGEPFPASPDYTPIIKGQYTFWAYENLEMLNTHVSDNIGAYYTNLVSAIDADIAASEAGAGNNNTYGAVTAVRLSEMKVKRSSVGGEVIPK